MAANPGASQQLSSNTRGAARRRFDVIVVGGGHNGLVCAAYVARAGLSVCVLERYDRIGGAAVTEEFHPGFRNSVASYTVSLLHPRVISDLELARHGLRIVPRPLANFVPSLDGPGLKLHRDQARTCAALAEHEPNDAARYPAYAAELRAITDVARSTLLEPPVQPDGGPREWARALALAWRLRRLPASTKGTLWELLGGSAGHWLDRWFECDLLKGALGFDGIVGHYASPYQPGSGYLLLHHCLGEVDGERGVWGHALGGMGAISSAMAAAASAYGAEIRLRRSVIRIERLGRGFTVHTNEGETYQAAAVAAAIHPQTLFMRMVDAALLPAPFLERMRAWRSESASFRINVALSELPDFTCLPGRGLGEHHTAGILFSPSLDYLEKAFISARAEGYSRNPVVELVIPSTIDSSLAPQGAHVASLFCQHFPRRLPAGSWRDAKDDAVDRIIGIVDHHAANFRRSVIAVQGFTPEELEQRFGLVGGDIFHGQMTLDQLYWARPAFGHAQYRTPVEGLYLAASGAHPGGGVTGAPGHNAARAILVDLRGSRARRAALRAIRRR